MPVCLCAESPTTLLSLGFFLGSFEPLAPIAHLSANISPPAALAAVPALGRTHTPQPHEIPAARTRGPLLANTATATGHRRVCGCPGGPDEKGLGHREAGLV